MAVTSGNPDVLPPAPGEDTHASLQLVNSSFAVPGGRVVESLASPPLAGQWLVERGLVPNGAVLQDYCTNRLTVVRAHVREVFAASIAGTSADPSAVEAINAELTGTPTARLLAWDPGTGFVRKQVHPTTLLVEHALAAIAVDAVALVTGEEAFRLATCGAEQCDRHLLRTHGRRRWCSIRCGDRMRAARSYARKKERLVLTG